MGGAYTAKPDASTVPVVPDDWNIEWPFPGVAPPGYEPFYVSMLDAPRTTYPGAEVYAVYKLADHGSHTTPAPSGTVTWSATLKSTGEAVNLKSAFEGEYAPTFSEDHYYLSETFYGTFYGSEPALNFEVSASNIGDYIVLKAYDTPFADEYLEGEKEILIVTDTPTPEEEEEEEEEDSKVEITLTVYMEMTYVAIGGSFADDDWTYDFELNVGGGSLGADYLWHLRRWIAPGTPPEKSYSMTSGAGASFSYTYSSDVFFENTIWDQLGFATLKAVVSDPGSNFNVGYTTGDLNLVSAYGVGKYSWITNTFVLHAKKNGYTTGYVVKSVSVMHDDAGGDFFSLGTVNGTTGVIT